MGSGWTGALGTGTLKTHQDGIYIDVSSEEEAELNYHDEEFYGDDLHLEQSGLLPIIPNFNVHHVSCGWGHSAIIATPNDDPPKDTTNNPSSPQLYLSGRPQEFQTLLRLQRLPTFLTDMIVPISHSLDQIGSDMIPFGMFSKFTHCPLPEQDIPIHVESSAGLTLILGSSQTLYSLGLNHHGQAGIGKTSNNVWTPTPVQMISTTGNATTSTTKNDPSDASTEDPIQNDKFQAMACGLQHALAIDIHGKVYSWGKNNRGQLGHGDTIQMCEFAKPIRYFQQSPTEYTKMKLVAAGLNHSVCVTDDNQAYIWGKNTVTVSSENNDTKQLQDSYLPTPINGLPPNQPIVDISCGSHHTSILFQDGSIYSVGIATDNHEPIFSEAVCTFQPNSIYENGNIRQFTSGYDRTTIISKDGCHIQEFQLWSQEEWRRNAPHVPSAVQMLQSMEKEDVRVKCLSRGWLHSVLITDDLERESR